MKFKQRVNTLCDILDNKTGGERETALQSLPFKYLEIVDAKSVMHAPVPKRWTALNGRQQPLAEDQKRLALNVNCAKAFTEFLYQNRKSSMVVTPYGVTLRQNVREQTGTGASWTLNYDRVYGSRPARSVMSDTQDFLICNHFEESAAQALAHALAATYVESFSNPASGTTSVILDIKGDVPLQQSLESCGYRIPHECELEELGAGPFIDHWTVYAGPAWTVHQLGTKSVIATTREIGGVPCTDL